MSKVEIRPAFEWTCDECGRNNFSSATIRNATPEEMAEALEFGESVEVISVPTEVECSFCGCEFEVDDSQVGDSE